MKKFYFTACFILINLACVFSQTVVNYSTSAVNIVNPSRGFYAQRETTISGNSTATYAIAAPLVASDLDTFRTGTRKNSLVLRLYYLNKFLSANITPAVLATMENDFNLIRTKGLKVILRFAYGSTAQTHRHSLDASKAQVLAHILQLKSLLVKHSDVILVVQTGFVGTYGEWFYTHPDFTVVTPVGDPNYPNRKEVSDALLAALPVGKMIQIRTPYYKFNAAMYGNGASGTAQALTLAEAFDGTPKSRIGHHNDCFLANSTDYGTYLDLVEDKNYLEQDSKYTFNGGETCNLDATVTTCSNALLELARFHFSYLHEDYNTTVLNSFKTNGCFNTIKQKLGYRLQLVNGTYTDVGSSGYKYNVDINLSNVGYAAPYEKKTVQLILKNTGTSATYSVTLPNVDNRFWLPGSLNINTSVGIGTNITNGTYNLYLALKDTGINIKDNPAYSIQLANTGTWEAATGYNLLKTFTVNNATNPGTGLYSGSQWFGTPASVLPIRFIKFNVSNENNTAILNWTIAQNGVLKYEIERSYDGNVFNAVKHINATNVNGTASYNFKDDYVLTSNIIYYRIKVVEANGIVSYSNIEKINNNNNGTYILNIFPAPAKDILQVELISAGSANAILSMIDLNGRVVKTVSKNVIKGYNNLNKIDISNLPSGMYLIRITINGVVLSTKLLKQ